MPSRRHLFSLQFAHALRESVLREPYSLRRFGQDALAGLTVGIAVVIVTLQLKDLFGLPIGVMPEHFIDKLQVLAEQAGAVHLPSVAVAALTLAVMPLWPRLRSPVPAYLPTVLLASVDALLLAGAGQPV